MKYLLFISEDSYTTVPEIKHFVDNNRDPNQKNYYYYYKGSRLLEGPNITNWREMQK